MTLDEAIKHCLEVAENNEQFASGKWIGSEGEANRQECEQCAADHRQLAEWLTELKELSLQIEAPRLGSIEEYHYELAKCKTAFWSCNRRCMNAEEQYRRKADELRKAQEQIAEYKRLLKAAVEDNKRVLRENFGDICQFCKHYSNSEAQCRKPHNGSGSWCCENAEWRYAAEALKLLGGSEK